MGYAKIKFSEDAVVVWCYCCEDYTLHEVFAGNEEQPTYYECNCGCVLDDSEDEIKYPDDNTREN